MQMAVSTANIPNVAIRDVDPFYAQVGTRVKRARRARSLTQEQLGTLVGVSQPVISDYELGITCPSLKVFYRISETLHVPADKLLGQRHLRVLNSK